MSLARDPSKNFDSTQPGASLEGKTKSSFDGEPTLDIPRGIPAPRNQEGPAGFIGPYQLLEKLGEGGMGQVWLAEQSVPVRRQVALKLIRSGIHDDAVARRFESERQALAIMEHPTIAKVFDAGSTPSGQPYLVMEYVPGLPITRYCDQKKLNIPERLELFIRVCEGVQHAHQKAIIHRDLKPSNILVVELDGQPAPRIIDFGIAKATSQGIGEQTQLTRRGSPMGTPGYMSPEQADPGLGDVDTRTDVYSLGVVLYELLAGAHPFDASRWQKQPFDEVLRQIREEDPPNPSTKLSREKETSDVTAKMRGTEPKQLVTLLRGDLDWITMKAMEKDRARRYGTPSELAADVARYLRNEPVVARPATTSYRLQKYVRRHRVGVAGAAGLAFLLVAFAAMQTVQLRRTTRERDRANHITTFVTSMFKVSDPSESRGNSITAREILDRASKDIDTGLAKDPELQVQMMNLMAEVYQTLGLYSRAELLSRRAVDIGRHFLGPEHPDTLKAITSLGWTLAREGGYAEAEKLDRDALEIQRRRLGPEHLSTLKTMNSLAWTLREEGHYAESENLYKTALNLEQRVLGAQHPDTVETMRTLGQTLMRQGRYAEAEKVDRDTLEIQRRVLGPEHPNTLKTMDDLGWVLQERGLYPEAEKLYRDTIDIQRRVLGPEHPNTLGTMNDLATTLEAEGHYYDAEELYRKTLDIKRRVLGPESPDTLQAMANLGSTLQREGHYSESEKLLNQTIELERRVYGREHPETLSTEASLALTLRSERHYPEAEKIQRELLDIRRRVLGPEHQDTLGAMQDLALTLSYRNQYGAAKKLFQEAIATAASVQGGPSVSSAWYSFARGAATAGSRDEAFQYLRQAIDNGYSNVESMGSDKELKSLRDEPRFAALIAQARERAKAELTK
ncbi:MAG TPA: serine/threonine-protein kinase [Terriglobales bacterium]|nr:serine/threonine-protein kinase [Terriglobales bacterium]